MMNNMPGVTSLAESLGERVTIAPGAVDLARLEASIRKAQAYLLERQKQQGYWLGELEADASVSAGYVPLMYFMRGEVDSTRRSKVVNYVKTRQNGDGSWSTYPGGPGDLNVSVQAYFALKLAGVPENEFDHAAGTQFHSGPGRCQRCKCVR